MLHTNVSTALLAATTLFSNPALGSGLHMPRQYSNSSIARTGTLPCDALITAGLGDRVILATNPLYENRTNSYFALNSRLRPWCIVQPQTAEEVSKALTALNSVNFGAGDWHIAVRSGGHATWAGASGIINGVTIDLGFFNQSSYDSSTNLASVGPGGRWKDVYADLLEYGVVVPGGRDGGVGVGGFLLGGGNSYYTGRYGLGCDSVINFEVVLANGSIVNANNAINSDLYKALKGGGGNFGIVTRFDIAAIPAVDIYAGVRLLDPAYSDDLVDAIVAFANNPVSAKDDALVGILVHDISFGPGILIGGSMVNTMGNTNSSSHAPLKAIPALADTSDLMSMADNAANFVTASGYRNVWFTLTFKADAQILKRSVELHEQFITSMSEIMLVEDLVTQVAIQPLPVWFSDLGAARGGNVMGFESWLTDAGVLWVTQARVLTEEQEAYARVLLSAQAAEIEDLAKSLDADLDWRYLNYADPSQDPLSSYGSANVDFIRKVASKYDPEGIFQTRVPGGFKISRIQ